MKSERDYDAIRELLRAEGWGDSALDEEDEAFENTLLYKKNPNMSDETYANHIHKRLQKKGHFLKDGGTVTDIESKLQGIVDGAYDYIMANCPKKPAYLQVGIRKYGDKYEMTAYVGAGWYIAYADGTKAMNWYDDLGKKIIKKYPQIEKFGMAGYGSSKVESKTHIDKQALAEQMNDPAYLRDKGLMKAGGTTKKLSEKQLWALIDNANWSSDNNYERIGKVYAKLSNEDYAQFKMFTSKLDNELSDKYEKAWLNKDGKGGFDVSDDGWSDLRAEVIGRGEKFYKSITAEKLREMAKRNEYTENFLYSLQTHKKFLAMLDEKESYCCGGKMKTGGNIITVKEIVKKWFADDVMNNKKLFSGWLGDPIKYTDGYSFDIDVNWEEVPNAINILNQKLKDINYSAKLINGDDLQVTPINTKAGRYNKMQKVKAFMDKFPNNATTWDKATDELATLNNSLGDFIDNYKGTTFITFGGELPNDTTLTPAKRNTNHKKIILKYLTKLSNKDFDTFYENFADWFENKMGIGGNTAKLWKYSIGGL